MNIKEVSFYSGYSERTVRLVIKQFFPNISIPGKKTELTLDQSKTVLLALEDRARGSNTGRTRHPKKCSVEYCDNDHYGLGYCEKHYSRFKKDGDVSDKPGRMHNMSNSPEYYSYRSMLNRCYNKTHKSYRWYGGKGITVCDKWIEGFIYFYQNLGDKPDKSFELDRINPAGNYEPLNCRWVSHKENTRRSGKVKLSPIKVVEIKNLWSKGSTVVDIANKYGCCLATIRLALNGKTWS